MPMVVWNRGRAGTAVFDDVDAADATVRRLSSDPDDVIFVLANEEVITFDKPLNVAMALGSFSSPMEQRGQATT